MATDDPDTVDIPLSKLWKRNLTSLYEVQDALHGTAFKSHDHAQKDPALYQEVLLLADQTRKAIQRHPYGLPLYVLLAKYYSFLAYPDLAAGAAYKALLLSDAIQTDDDEYHECTVAQCIEILPQITKENKDHASNGVHGDTPIRDNVITDATQLQAVVEHEYLPDIYRLLASNLYSCECYRSAYTYSSQGSRLYPTDPFLPEMTRKVRRRVAERFRVDLVAVESGAYSNPATWPDRGLVRRERYPWNTYEPKRFEELSTLNSMMSEVAPKLEILAVELPDLTTSAADSSSWSVKQLGVFAKDDISPGESILVEQTLLTANNKLQDALCDACSSDLPALNSATADAVVSCPDCEVVFCSQSCLEKALELYHPAVCDTDVETIAKDVPSTEAAAALYSLLLLRSLAMAETQQCHPLELKEVKYIWGDFHNTTIITVAEAQTAPKTLPFGFENNIRLPFHMLEKMGIDIFANPQYDVWVFNTLYAKFRGTASARLSGLGGRPARGPEVSAVHPMWCMANHSCDPNVIWDWGGSITFLARDRRKSWQSIAGEKRAAKEPGIKKGEEVLNHYCDIDLPVHERREWAEGSLGGDCRCERCVWEAGDKV